MPWLSPTPAAQMWTFRGAQLPGAELGRSRISALARFFSCVHFPGYIVNSRSLVCPRISWRASQSADSWSPTQQLGFTGSDATAKLAHLTGNSAAWVLGSHLGHCLLEAGARCVHLCIPDVPCR